MRRFIVAIAMTGCLPMQAKNGHLAGPCWIWECASHEHGTYVPPTAAERCASGAREACQRGCQEGDAGSCRAVARGLPPDRALAWIRRACELDGDTECLDEQLLLRELELAAIRARIERP